MKLVSVKVEREPDIQDVTEEDLVSFSGQHQEDIQDLVSIDSRNADPNDLQIQLEYMLTERPWKRAFGSFKTPGKSIDSYMRSAHIWLGWGVHGERTNYAYDYADRLYWG